VRGRRLVAAVIRSARRESSESPGRVNALAAAATSSSAWEHRRRGTVIHDNDVDDDDDGREEEIRLRLTRRVRRLTVLR